MNFACKFENICIKSLSSCILILVEQWNRYRFSHVCPVLKWFLKLSQKKWNVTITCFNTTIPKNSKIITAVWLIKRWMWRHTKVKFSVFFIEVSRRHRLFSPQQNFHHNFIVWYHMKYVNNAAATFPLQKSTGKCVRFHHFLLHHKKVS